MQNYRDLFWYDGLHLTTLSASYSFEVDKSYWNGTFQRNGAVDRIFREHEKTPIPERVEGVFRDAFLRWEAATAYALSESLTGDAARIYVYGAPGVYTAAPGSAEVTGSFASYLDGFDDVVHGLAGRDYYRSEISVNPSEYPKGARLKYVALHEIGHSLGLNELGYSEDYTASMSVMSYNVKGGRFPVTPMPYDHLAMLYLLGRAPETATGNTVYSIENGWFKGAKRAQTIVDSSGMDTFDFGSAETDVIIDLRQAVTFDSEWIGARTKYLKEEIYLSYLTNIEVGLGGSGHDLMHADSGTRLLSGAAGNDSIFGDGFETLKGGKGDDQISSKNGATILAGPGQDRIFLLGDGNDVSGGPGADTIRSDGRANKIQGGDGTDRIFLNGEQSVVSSGKGADTVRLIDTAGEVSLGAGNDRLFISKSGGHYNGGNGSDTFVFLPTFFQQDSFALSTEILDLRSADEVVMRNAPGNYSTLEYFSTSGDDIVVKIVLYQNGPGGEITEPSGFLKQVNIRVTHLNASKKMDALTDRLVSGKINEEDYEIAASTLSSRFFSSVFPSIDDFM